MLIKAQMVRGSPGTFVFPDSVKLQGPKGDTGESAVSTQRPSRQPATLPAYLGTDIPGFDGTFPSLNSKPTTIAGYGITDFNSLGDARWQPLDADLSALAALATNAFGRGLLPLTDAAAVRAYIGAGSSSFDGAFASLTGIPTTIGGYGITDFNSLGDARWSVLAHVHTFASLTSKPTTISGYGISDAFTQAAADALYSVLAHTHSFASLTSVPTTVSGYGITDFNSLGDARWSLLAHDHTFASLTSKPTTISGYGITDLNSLGDARWQALDADLTAIAALADPNADRILFWDDSAGTWLHLTLGTNLSITDTTLNAAGGGGAVATDVIFDAKGDLAVGTGADTAIKLTVGANDTMAIADSTQTAGIRWGTPASVRTALGLVIGTNVQAFDADLTTWAGITPASGVGTFLATPSSANLLAALTTKTGTGNNVFADSPTFATKISTPAVVSTDTGYNQPQFFQFVGGDVNWGFGVRNAGSNYHVIANFAGASGDGLRGFAVMNAQGGADIFRTTDAYTYTQFKLGIGTTTFGTSAVNVLGIQNGTEPSTSPADMVQLYSVDLSAGNATLGIRTERAVVTESVVSDRTLSVRINGTTYKLCLKV